MDENRTLLREKKIKYKPQGGASLLSSLVTGDLVLTSSAICFEWSEGVLKKTAKSIEIPFTSIQIHDGIARISASKPEEFGGDYPLTVATVDGEETFLFPPDRKKQIGPWYEAIQEAITGTRVEFDSRDIGDLKIGSFLKNAVESAKPITSGIAEAASPILDAAAPLVSVAANVAADRHPIATAVVGAGIETQRQKQAQDSEGLSDSMVLEEAAPNNAETNTPAPTAGEASLDSQIEAVKKLKELLDAGILTQEEFDAKKKQVMGL